MQPLSRRKCLFGGVPAAAAGGLAAAHALVPQGGGTATASAAETSEHAAVAHRGSAHQGVVGRVSPAPNGFDPRQIARDFDHGRTRRGADGRTVREWEIVAEDKEIEVAPGVKFAAWTYNERVPGPTLRAREGERLRVRFVNGSSHPHTIHFHGIHRAEHDGVPGLGAGNIAPGLFVSL